MRNWTNQESSSDQARSTRILVVDDSPAVRESASAYLTDAGYTVFTAGDGFEGLSRLEQNRPGVVLADIMMPRIDGYQMCAMMKSNTDYQGIPVIMLSGKDGLVDESRATLVGGDSHLAKPFSAVGIVTAVGEYCSSSTDDSE